MAALHLTVLWDVTPLYAGGNGDNEVSVKGSQDNSWCDGSYVFLWQYSTYLQVAHFIRPRRYGQCFLVNHTEYKQKLYWQDLLFTAFECWQRHCTTFSIWIQPQQAMSLFDDMKPGIRVNLVVKQIFLPAFLSWFTCSKSSTCHFQCQIEMEWKPQQLKTSTLNSNSQTFLAQTGARKLTGDSERRQTFGPE